MLMKFVPKKCPNCDGKGFIPWTEEGDMGTGGSYKTTIQTMCHSCYGTGIVYEMVYEEWDGN